MSVLVRAPRANEESPEDTAGSRAVEPAPPGEVLWRGFLGSLLAAVVASVLLQASTLGLFSIRWLGDQLVSGVGFYVDTLVIWLFLGLLWAVLGRLWWAIGALAATVLTAGAATLVKIQYREEPVYPSDVEFLREPGFLTSLVSPVLLLVAAVLVVGVIAGTALLGRRMARRYPRPRLRDLRRGHAWSLVGARVLVGLVAALLLAQAVHFNQPGNLWRGMYEVRGEHWRYWNQKTNYRSNGFIGGFLFNMPVDAMAEPEGYDDATMDAIAERYERLAARVNAGRTGTLDDTNVVMVLSESFSDPTQLRGFELARDPIPRTRARMAGTTSGRMLSQMYGGGTANMEFEALTGQSLGLFRPQMLSPYQMLVPAQRDYPSAVGWFRAHGHDVVAVHPFGVGMYKREQVYERFGFESFVHDTTIRETDRIDDNPYISDESAFDEVLAQIDEHERPLMVNLVTMQNHIPVTGNYDDPIDVSGTDGEERIGQYARGLEHTDEALDDFLAALERRPEKTIVLFYGDHLPGIYDSTIKRENAGIPLYRTPFLIWSNQPELRRPRTVPTTSPAFFLPLLYEFANAPVPPYLALLGEVHEHVSALQQGRMLAPSGERVEESDLTPEAAQLLADLRLVQFDLSIGERRSLERMWPGSVVPRG